MHGSPILVVDDDPSAEAYLSLTLRQAGHTVRSARNGLEALLAIEKDPPALVISDMKMPVMDGLELLAHVRQRWPRLPVVLLSVAQDVPTVVRAVQLGAVNYVVKPAPPAVLLAAVRRIFESPAPRPVDFDPTCGIVGVSRAIVEARHLAVLAARSDVNVLITGRTGTGKELIARAIHRRSRQAGGPFVAHNCAATPPDLFESQFFGHRRGAFTGAERDVTGLLERSDAGVLFLDEMESLSLQHQAKLLRVLDDGEVRPVGCPETRRVDVRYLAATNHDPVEAIAAGQLREDLYYRLRGFQISLPPLRDRQEDLPHLAAHFLEGADRTLAPEAMDALLSHEWPGNVRELRNVLRVACVRASGGVIRPEHLGLDGRGAAHPAIPAPLTLRQIERQAILRALKEHGGNRSRAARALGIDRSTLRRKMKEVGVEKGPGG